MIKIILEKWERKKDRLKNVFETLKGLNECNYKDIVKLTFDVIYNEEEQFSNYRLDIDSITEIDNGDYQGTLLYLIPFNTYQPSESEYLMTYVDYGSCSGCDTLQRIQSDWNYYEDREHLNERQVNDFMKLSKDILQNTIKPYNRGWRNDERFEHIEVA